jgi:hypothetical protein
MKNILKNLFWKSNLTLATREGAKRLQIPIKIAVKKNDSTPLHLPYEKQKCIG